MAKKKGGKKAGAAAATVNGTSGTANDVPVTVEIKENTAQNDVKMADASPTPIKPTFGPPPPPEMVAPTPIPISTSAPAHVSMPAPISIPIPIHSTPTPPPEPPKVKPIVTPAPVPAPTPPPVVKPVEKDVDVEMMDVEDDGIEKPDPEALKEEGNAKYKQKKYLEAAEFYSQAIDLRPKEASYLTNRAAAYMAIKRFKAALADCQSASFLQSSAPQSKTLIRLAKCHLAVGSPSACLLTIQQALALDPKDKTALECKTKAEVMQGFLERFESSKKLKDWGQAKWALEKAVEECEGDQPIQWRIWRVEVDIARKKWDDAIQQASDALRMDQNHPDTLAVRGLALFLTNKVSLAIEHLQRALRLDQEHTRARVLLKRAKDVEKKKEEGNAAFKSNRLGTAAEKWTETLEAIGEKEEEGEGGHIRAVLLSNRATVYHKLNRLAEAMADIQKSIELLPSSFKAMRTQARIRLAQEDYDQAMIDFNAAKEAAEISSDAKPTDIKGIEEELKNAEVQLKRSKTKDYYKVLGVAKTCTEIEIKKAYRRESLIHHPDKGGDEEKFKLVVEAHTVLSDPQRRQRYDSGADEDGSMDSGMGGMDGGVDINDIFAAMGGGFGGGGFPGGGFPGGGFPGGGGRGGRGGGSRSHFHSHGGF